MNVERAIKQDLVIRRTARPDGRKIKETQKIKSIVPPLVPPGVDVFPCQPSCKISAVVEQHLQLCRLPACPFCQHLCGNSKIKSQLSKQVIL